MFFNLYHFFGILNLKTILLIIYLEFLILLWDSPIENAPEKN